MKVKGSSGLMTAEVAGPIRSNQTDNDAQHLAIPEEQRCLRESRRPVRNGQRARDGINVGNQKHVLGKQEGRVCAEGMIDPPDR